MKKSKIIITISVFIVLFSLLLNVQALPLYSAVISLNPSKGTSKTIYVNVNESVSVSLNLKTSEGFFAGPFSAPVFYTDSVFKAESPTMNTSGKFYNCCKTYTNTALSDKIDPQIKKDLYPSSWNDKQISENNLIYTVMVPNAKDSLFTPDKLNEQIWTAVFKVKDAVGSQGKIFIPKECIKSDDNLDGSLSLSCFTDGGDVSSAVYDYGKDISIDVSNAEIIYKVTDVADVDNDKHVTSADALFMLQISTGLKKPDAKTTVRADVDCDGKVTSSDALAALMISTNAKTINDYLK